MTVRVDSDVARKLLDEAWSKIEDAKISPAASTLSKIQEVLTAKDVTYKYILVTGILAKLTNPKAHPRSFQASSKLEGAYDARSLCHSVIVTFEKDKGNLFGQSNEPFVNKPARHPEHDKANTQLKNRHLAGVTHDALEDARVGNPKEVEAMLVAALRIGKRLADSRISAVVNHGVSLNRVLTFVSEFLKENDGGARLAAVVGTFITLLSDDESVSVYPPNYSDKFAKTFGDVEVKNEEQVVSAFECKHRALTIDDVSHGIKKAREGGVQQYCFVVADGVKQGDEEPISDLVRSVANEKDCAVVNIRQIAMAWALAITPEDRGMFGVTITTILGTSMKRTQVADQAAALWNSLK